VRLFIYYFFSGSLILDKDPFIFLRITDTGSASIYFFRGSLIRDQDPFFSQIVDSGSGSVYYFCGSGSWSVYFLSGSVNVPWSEPDPHRVLGLKY
jgi:hypothetical protein